jgi:four helix bundle protein
MTNPNKYDLEERTYRFAKEVIGFVNVLSKSLSNVVIMKQVVRSSGSVGANYIEANEALGKRDFKMRSKICRKEAEESVYWLKLLEVNGKEGEITRRRLMDEATQLTKIFSSILQKSK